MLAPPKQGSESRTVEVVGSQESSLRSPIGRTCRIPAWSEGREGRVMVHRDRSWQGPAGADGPMGRLAVAVDRILRTDLAGPCELAQGTASLGAGEDRAGLSRHAAGPLGRAGPRRLAVPTRAPPCSLPDDWSRRGVGADVRLAEDTGAGSGAGTTRCRTPPTGRRPSVRTTGQHYFSRHACFALPSASCPADIGRCGAPVLRPLCRNRLRVAEGSGRTEAGIRPCGFDCRTDGE